MPTHEGIAKCWAVLEAEGFARPHADAQATETSIRTWAAILADVSDDRLQALTLAWLRSSAVKFGRWPHAGELLHALGDEQQVDDADEAWSEVLSLVRWRGIEWCRAKVGDADAAIAARQRLVDIYREAVAKGDQMRARDAEDMGKRLVRGPEERIRAAYVGLAAVGGWRGLGMSETDQETANRASFRAAYRSHRQRAQLTRTEAQVAGLLDAPRLRALPGGRS